MCAIQRDHAPVVRCCTQVTGREDRGDACGRLDGQRVGCAGARDLGNDDRVCFSGIGVIGQYQGYRTSEILDGDVGNCCSEGGIRLAHPDIERPADPCYDFIFKGSRGCGCGGGRTGGKPGGTYCRVGSNIGGGPVVLGKHIIINGVVEDDTAAKIETVLICTKGGTGHIGPGAVVEFLPGKPGQTGAGGGYPVHVGDGGNERTVGKDGSIHQRRIVDERSCQVERDAPELISPHVGCGGRIACVDRVTCIGITRIVVIIGVNVRG